MSLCLATALVLHVGSVHLPQEDNNNFNPGIGMGCAVTESISISNGIYYNSQRRVSAYSALTATMSIGAGFRAGGSVGVATGYRDYSITPIAGFLLQTPTLSGWGASVFIAPKTGMNSGVAHLSFFKGF